MPGPGHDLLPPVAFLESVGAVRPGVLEGDPQGRWAAPEGRTQPRLAAVATAMVCTRMLPPTPPPADAPRLAFFEPVVDAGKLVRRDLVREAT